MTRGPQYRTKWLVEQTRFGCVVHATLDGYQESKAFTFEQMTQPRAVCARLTRMQQMLNTTWYYWNRMATDK